jgi:U4/U6.U5 tri-snRNP-associated protein 3
MTEEEQMKVLLGIGGFDSTKGKSVPGKDVGAVNITKKVFSLFYN